MYTVGSLLGVPTMNRLTVGMISLVNNEQQPTPAVEARLRLSLSQADQYRRRRRSSQDTPRRRRHRAVQHEEPHEQHLQHLAVQQRDTVVLAKRQLTHELLDCNYKSFTQFMEMLTHMVTTPTIDMEVFDPDRWADNEQEHLWWTWVTWAQLEQYKRVGTIPGYKTAQHGDSAHPHHRFHNKVDHCVNMAIHHRWRTMNKRVYYGEHQYGGNKQHRPIFLMVWRQSIADIRRLSVEHGMHSASIYF
eukprot:2670001-Amphidinium_carterae.3